MTRREGSRLCRNAPEVERFFASHGFDVVHPGRLSIAEQAGTFARAEVVAGFGGTGMFNLAFCHDLRQVVVLNHTAYDARNEQLMAAVHGADLDYFWSEPEVRHPPRRRSRGAFQSAWTFDLEMHRDALGDVLTDQNS